MRFLKISLFLSYLKWFTFYFEKNKLFVSHLKIKIDEFLLSGPFRL